MKSILRAVVLVFALGATPVLAAANSPNQIEIHEYLYNPATFKVAVGTKVTWINRDDIPHTIVESAVNKTFRSGALDTNDTYSFTFTKPGTYKYFCTLHPQMVGTIVVTP
jgi:amicyanin